MFARRGGGPSRSTPANVQCQKSRHYSYECKASSQDRPYVSRPSRSQQLRNPKLVPKLTNETLKPLEDKKGVADQELAKRETERARKRELEEREDELVESQSKRRRSVSSESVSTISTNASRRSMSPRRRPPSPARRAASRSHDDAHDRRPRHDRPRDSRSPSPAQRRYRSSSRGSYSSAHQDDEPDRTRFAGRPSDHIEEDRGGRDARHTPQERDRRFNRSPRGSFEDRSPAYEDEHREQRGQRHHGRNERDTMQGQGYSARDRRPARQENTRERSLSPFSKRLALTRSQKGMDS